MRLAYSDREGVKFVIVSRVAGDRVEGESRAGKSGECVVCWACGRERRQLVAFDDAAEILVGDWDRVVEGVEQDGIGSLWANSGQSHQAGAQDCR